MASGVYAIHNPQEEGKWDSSSFTSSTMSTVAPYVALFQKLGSSAETVYNALQANQSNGNYSQDNLVAQEKQKQAVSRQMIKEAFAVMAEVMATTGSNDNLTDIQHGYY